MRTLFAGVVVVAGLLGPGLAAAAPQAAPQPAPAVTVQVNAQELVLRDGSRMYGTVEREDDAEVVFRTQAGATVTVKRTDIASLKPVKGVVINGEFMPPDPNTSRLFFGPTARSLPKGKTYIGVYEFLMPFVQVGITDRLSIGGGTPLVFGFDEGERPFWVTPKLQIFDTGRTQLAAGVFHGFNWDGDGGGIAYAVGSRGTEAGSFTLGAGVAYDNEGDTAGVAMVGGEIRLRRNLKFITENYIWEGGYGVASFGVRFIGERLSADLALGVPINADDFIIFPVVNFVYAF